MTKGENDVWTFTFTAETTIPFPYGFKFSTENGWLEQYQAYDKNNPTTNFAMLQPGEEAEVYFATQAELDAIDEDGNRIPDNATKFTVESFSLFIVDNEYTITFDKTNMKVKISGDFEELSYYDYDLEYISGNMTDSSMIGLTDNTYTFVADYYNYFTFYTADGGFYAGGATITALDTEFALVANSNECYFADGVLTEGKIYTITLIVKGEHEAYVKVTEAQPGSISITSTPYKTSYYVGEELNLDGLTVEATYSDGSTSVVTVTSDMVSGFDSSAVGNQTLTVTYGDCTATFDVEVVEITADNVADCLAGLDSGNASYTIAVTGEISTITLSNIKAAIANNSSIKINLDLSGTTGLTEIPDDAFYTCSGLTSVTIPNSVTSIGDNAFGGCNNLKSIIIPESVTNIGYSLFSGCTELVTVTIPDSITEIKVNMFSNCTSLTNITIPESITTIDNAAFYNCKSLISVTIPDSVTSIGAQAFYLCHSLASAIFTTNTDTWYYTSNSNYSDGIVIDVTNSSNNAAYLRDIYASHYWYKDANITATANDVVEKISNFFYREYTLILTGEIDSTTIENIKMAMKNNPSARINLDLTETEGLLEIADSAFSYCVNLISIIIPNSVTSICNSAFLVCPNLVSVTIGSGVISVGDNAFNSCDSLTTVNYKGTQEQWEQISIGSNNDYLTGANINYNYTDE